MHHSSKHSLVAAAGVLLFALLFIIGLSPGPTDRLLAQVAPSSGLIAYYSFDGNTNDSVGGNNGTLTGGATYAAGKIGQALSFAGTANPGYVSIALTSGFNVREFTASLWANTADTNWHDWWSIQDGSANEMVGEINGLTGAPFSATIIGFSGVEEFGGGGSVVNAGWKHLTWTFSQAANQALLYVDGVQVASAAHSPASAAITTLMIGSRISSPASRAALFFGDDVRIYNRALSAQEVSDLYASAGGGSPPPTCTSFTYSSWGTCQSNSTQTRSVQTSSPSGCTGGSPVLSQSCTYTPPASDTTAPTVSLSAPSAGTVSGSISVSATAADNVGVSGVQFKLDGSNLGSEDTSSPYSISWNTSGASNGAHTLTATARNAAGNQTTSSGVNVTVNNTVVTPPPSGGAWPPVRSSGAGSVGRDGDGWTIITPAADSRLIYVSAAGNDANDGLSESSPKRTVAAGKALLRNQMPDWLLLRAGDTWNEFFGRISASGRSSQEPSVITYYGSGNRPVLSVPVNETGFFTMGGTGSPPNVNHVSIIGITVVASNKMGAGGRGEGFQFLRGGTDLLLEDIVIDGFNTGLDIQGADTPQTDVIVRRNIIRDNYSNSESHSQGIFTSKVTNLLIEENTVDMNGWLPGFGDGTVFNHNFYIGGDNYQVTISSNISSRASSHGLQLRPGGIARNNLFLRNAIAFFDAGDNHIDPILVENNVTMESTDTFNANGTVAASRGWGEDLFGDTANGSTHQRNIFVDRLNNNQIPAILTSYSGNPAALWTIRDNVIRNWNDNANQGISIDPSVASHYQTSGNIVDGRNRETGAVVSLPDPNRSLRTYMQSIGFTVNSADEAFNTFIQQARNRPLRTWDTRFIAATVNDYMRAGLMPGGSGTPSPTCTSFTYSAYGACQSNNTQTRTVSTQSPSGCTGGSPITSQSCTYVAPTCSSFTYSAWSSCSSNNTQSRTALTSSPSGCTGGSPVTSQSCTYTPPLCTSFTYSAWGICGSDSIQTRTALTSNPSGCDGGSPSLSQSCTYTPPAPSAPTCSSFTYSSWSSCSWDGTQERTALTAAPSGCVAGTPVLYQTCTFTPPLCTQFTYSAWSQCAPDSLQSRTALTSTPQGCSGGSPVQTQSCTYTPSPVSGGNSGSPTPTPYTSPAYIGTPSAPLGTKVTPPAPSTPKLPQQPSPSVVPVGGTECSDGIDNDFDGTTDMADLDCTSSTDNAEIIDLWRILRQILYFLLQWLSEMWGRGMKLIGR